VAQVPGSREQNMTGRPVFPSRHFRVDASEAYRELLVTHGLTGSRRSPIAREDKLGARRVHDQKPIQNANATSTPYLGRGQTDGSGWCGEDLVTEQEAA
jgi:hypothetical protein